MRVISILGQKGGSGKTTLATNLAAGLIREGHKTVIIDTDPQQSAMEWSKNSPESSIPVFGVVEKDLKTSLSAIDPSYSFAILDGTGKLELKTSASIRLSDLILIPVQPSPYDVWACAELAETIRFRRESNDGLPKAYFVISRQRSNTKLSREVGDAIVEYCLPVFSSGTTDREVYKQSASSGLSVFDMANIGGISDMTAITKEVLEVFEC